MEEPNPQFLVGFVRSVAVLALDATTQLAWSRQLTEGLDPLIDELALGFDDGFRLVPIFIERGWLNAEAVPALTALDQHLRAMSGEHHAHLWHAEALTDRAEWDRLRQLARAALAVLV